MKSKILADFQICISAPLNMNSVSLHAYNKGVTESVMEPAIDFTEPFS